MRYIKKRLLDLTMIYLAYIFINDRDLYREYVGEENGRQ